MKTSKLQHHVHDDSCFAAIPKTRPTPGSLPSLPRIDPELVSLDLHPGYRKAEAAIAGHPAVPRGRSFPESRVRACPFPKTARCTRMRCPSAAQVTWELWTRVVMARGSASQISCWSLQWTSPEHCGESFHATVHLAAPCGQRTSCRPEGSHTMHSTASAWSCQASGSVLNQSVDSDFWNETSPWEQGATSIISVAAFARRPKLDSAPKTPFICLGLLIYLFAILECLRTSGLRSHCSRSLPSAFSVGPCGIEVPRTVKSPSASPHPVPSGLNVRGLLRDRQLGQISSLTLAHGRQVSTQSHPQALPKFRAQQRLSRPQDIRLLDPLVGH